MDPKQEVETLLKKELKLKEISLETPKDSEYGDYAFPCFVLAQKFKKNPAEIAKELAGKIEPTENIDKIISSGPYLNFFVKKGNLAADIIPKILKEKNNFGSANEKGKILVEYITPNTNKPLHLGHMRNAFIGQSIINFLNFRGNKVTKTNLMNDRGIHICKSMLAYKKWGKGKKPNKKTDRFVGDMYVLYAKKAKDNPEIEEELKEMLQKWEAGDNETRELWKKMNGWAYKGFEETFKKIDVKYDKTYYESKLYEKGKKIVLTALKKGLFEKDETGAVIARLEKHGLPDKVLIRSDGTSIYITQDIYLAEQKNADFKPDKSIYVVAVEQDMHFKQLFKILEILGHKWAKNLHHLSYGMVNLPEGRMKSREGIVVDADDTIEEVIGLAKQEIKKRHKLSKAELDKRASIIGLGALRFNLLLTDSKKDIVYDPKKAIEFEGETGPYIQYSHARICSIFRKYGKKIPSKADFKWLNTESEKRIITLLAGFPGKVAEAAENYKPHVVARYLLDLSQAFNEFYHSAPIIQERDEIRDARLLLANSVKQVIANGLDLLGIESPEEM